MTCERGAYKIELGPDDPNIRSYLPNADGSCDHKVMRRSVIEASQNMRGMGKVHNRHAKLDRKSHAQRAKELGLAQPDLMVSRHIREGRDIKKEG